MQICIRDCLIGADNNLIFDTKNETYAWARSVPDDAWVVGDENHDKSLDRLIEMVGHSDKLIPEKRYFRMFEQVRKVDGLPFPIMWKDVLPKTKYKDFVQGVLDGVRASLDDEVYNYYMSVLRDVTRCLGTLERALIDDTILWSHIRDEDNPTVSSTLRTFMPGTDGYADVVKYNQFASTTGRLTVESGPNILILSKKYRDIIKSRYDGGKIMMVDFVSLEPRIALLESGRPVEEDIYGHLSREVIDIPLKRALVKLITISLLYGARHQKIKELTGLDDEQLNYIIPRVHSHFGIRPTTVKLIDEFKRTGRILNRYGRPVTGSGKNRVLYNHYIQSTACDASLLGFSAMVDKIRNDAALIHPLFVIHDGMILDVHPDYFGYLDGLRAVCSNVKGFDVPLPIKIEEV